MLRRLCAFILTLAFSLTTLSASGAGTLLPVSRAGQDLRTILIAKHLQRSAPFLSNVTAMPIPKNAKRRLMAFLANPPKAILTGEKRSADREQALASIHPDASTPPSTSCADMQLNNTLYMYPGSNCVVSEPSGAFFGSCTWTPTSSNSPQVNLQINPIVAPAGTNSTVTFQAPGNLTSGISAAYTAQASCGDGEFTYTIYVLPPPEQPCHRCNGTGFGSPVDVATGEEYYTDTDVSFSGPFGLSFTRAHSSQSIGTNALGANWQNNFDAHLDLSQLSTQTVAFFDETNKPFYFNNVPTTGSVYDSNSGDTLTVSAGPAYVVSDFSSRKWDFDSKGELTGLADRFGNVQTITRDATVGHNDRILTVTDPLSRKLCFYYDTSNRITELSWLANGACPSSAPTSGTLVKLAYDSGTACITGELCSVTEPDGKKWTYQYLNDGSPFASADLTQIVDPQGDPEEINTYSGFQVTNQVTGKCTGAPPCADTGGDLTFTYPGNFGGIATITDGQGGITSVSYDLNTFMLLEVSGPQCKCGGDQTRSYTYDAYERTQTASDDGVDGSTSHTFTYSYGRDAGGSAYPGPTKSVENLDTSGTTRTTGYQYYPIGDPRQDLVQITTIPSVDTAGDTVTTTDTYQTNGTLTSRATAGHVNGVATTYTWKWTYDSRGRVLTSVGPRTDVVQKATYKYFSDTDADGNRAGQLQTLTDALSHVTTYSGYSGFTSYTPFGRPQSMTDPNGVNTEYTYDARGRMLTSTLLGVPGDTSNLVTTWTYDGAGRITGIKWPAGNGLGLGYDTSDRLTNAARLDSGSLQHERLSFAYNTIDQPTSLAAQACATPAASCSSWLTEWNVSYGYTPATSNMSTITNPDSTFRKFSYIDSGALSTYNDENHETGSNYTYGYDVAGRKLSETRKLGSGTVVSKYVRDLHDNVNSITDENGNVTTYHYDDFDRITKEVSPVQGTTTYAYDPDNDLLSKTDSNSAVTTYTYDALDRELTESAVKSGQTLASSWTYDDATSGHYGIGRLETMADPSGSTTYTYERRGFVASEANTIVGNSFSKLYAYDANGNRDSITYPDGKIVAYTFDFADRPLSVQQTGTMSPAQLHALAFRGQIFRPAAPEAAPGTYVPTTTMPVRNVPRLRPREGLSATPGGARATVILPGLVDEPGQTVTRSVTGNAITFGTSTTRSVHTLTSNPEVFVSAATYEPFGPIASISYGNGTVQTFSYNTRYFPTENKLVGSSTLGDYVYGEDAVGNINALTDKVNAAYDRSFQYDDLNRITTANSGSSLWGTATGNGYTYDNMGNLKTLKLGTGRTDTFSYSGTLPKLTSVLENGSSRTVSYDSFGNLLGDGKSTFTYSSRELLATDSRFIKTYYYNGFRQRVATQISSNSDYRDSLFDPSQHVLSETAQFASGTPSIAYDYIWFGDRPVSQLDSGGTHWTFADHLGTPLNQTNATPAITWQAEYEPYGNVWTDRVGSTLHQPLRLPGQTSEQFDSTANGLTERSYNNARWYRPTWGRYDEADPLGPKVSGNLYGYADDRPINWFDMTGMLPMCFPLPLPVYIGYGKNHAFGCYCGQHYTNGQDLNEVTVGSNNIGPPIGPAPIGPLDSCCLSHDRCTSTVGNNQCLSAAARHGALCSCHKTLSSCVISNVKPGSYANYGFGVAVGAFSAALPVFLTPILTVDCAKTP
jgi:RHS repeat-associated protein